MAIEHIVVLMLENRSFDHMLGYLDLPNIDGLTGNEQCDPVTAGDPAVAVRKTTGALADFRTCPDPGHELADVNVQLFGSRNPAPNAKPQNRGFVQSYAGQNRPGGCSPVAIPEDIMKCFDPAHLPVLTNLARNYVVCDRWFCSVPSSTWPNRYFVHGATSMGHADITNAQARSYLLNPSLDMHTIFNRISDAGLDWSVYYHQAPQAGTLRSIGKYLIDPNYFCRFEAGIDNQTGHLFDGFEKDAANGALPLYTFIEPQTSIISALDFAILDNSQHPPADVRDGERLIARVYNALRSGPLWESTLLLIIYDEHGGFYDHIPPPRVPPETEYASQSAPFKFDRLGPRVPAVIVSPWVDKGRVDHGPTTGTTPDDHIYYDHTSVIATVLRMIGQPPLTGRDTRAATFEHLYRQTVRSDADCLKKV